ncbi:ABC transporter permease [Candidatus Woesearchaeota archaeon]|nr:ABC transporter permease [Candidatus Woesearchaeota archaeon]
MDFRDYMLFTWGHIKHNSLRTWLTMIGIFVGIATIVSLISLGTGLEEAITSRFSSLGADKIIVQNSQTLFAPPGQGTVDKLNDRDLRVVKQTKGFELVIGRLLRFESIGFKNKIIFGAIISVPSTSQGVELINEFIGVSTVAGRQLKANDRGKIVMGYDFYNKELFEKKLRVGDKVTIKDKSFSIAGFLQRTGQPFGETFVMMNEEDMKNLLDINDEWDIIVGKVAEGIDSVAVGKTLDKKFLQDRGLKEWEKDYTIQTPDDIIDSLGNILLVVQAILVGIASISLIVGGIGIMNTMYTAVLERTGEIGIIKSIGARNSTVLLIFLFESGMLGLVGGLIGLLLGVILSLTVQFFGTLYFGTQLLNASFPTYLMIGALLFSFSVGSFAGTFPAVRASRLKPVDALRYRK